MEPIYITSEIGRLKTVLLHRPGEELENLTPDTLHDLLFDDIPHLKVAQEEHDKFAAVLRERGIEVLYLDELAAEALADDAVRKKCWQPASKASGALPGRWRSTCSAWSRAKWCAN